MSVPGSDRRERSGLSADDVAQEVCLAAIQALPRYRIRDARFWPSSTASLRTRSPTRIARRRNSVRPTDVVPERYSLDAGPEQMAVQSDSAARMNRLLAVLPEKQREILTLRIVVGLSAEETAEAVGSTPGAVRVAQHRALARLKSRSREQGLDYA